MDTWGLVLSCGKTLLSQAMKVSLHNVHRVFENVALELNRKVRARESFELSTLYA